MQYIGICLILSGALPPCDAIYINDSVIATREWCSYGTLWHGVDPCGLSNLNGNDWLGISTWNFATRLNLYS